MVIVYHFAILISSNILAYYKFSKKFVFRPDVLCILCIFPNLFPLQSALFPAGAKIRLRRFAREFLNISLFAAKVRPLSGRAPCISSVFPPENRCDLKIL